MKVFYVLCRSEHEDIEYIVVAENHERCKELAIKRLGPEDESEWHIYIDEINTNVEGIHDCILDK